MDSKDTLCIRLPQRLLLNHMAVLAVVEEGEKERKKGDPPFTHKNTHTGMTMTKKQ